MADVTPVLRTPLSQILARDFGDTIRQRGAGYFHDGRVHIESSSASHVRATVSGSAAYRVVLARQGLRVRASCTCPYFDADLCKHVWAVILAADARHLLQGDGDNRGLRLLAAADEGDEPDDEDAADGADEDHLDGLGHADREDELDEDEPDQEEPGVLTYQWPRRAAPASAARPPVARGSGKAPGPDLNWRKRLAQLGPASSRQYAPRREEWRAGRQMVYVVDVAASRATGAVLLEIFTRDPKRDGTWGVARSRHMPREWLHQIPDADDRHILASLAGAAVAYDRTGAEGHAYRSPYAVAGGFYDQSVPFRYRVPDALAELVLPLLCRTGRCRLRLQPDDAEAGWAAVTREEQSPWRFRVEVRRAEQAARYEMHGVLVRGAERLDLTVPLLLVNAGFLFLRDSVGRFEHHDAFEWIRFLREHGPVFVPLSQADEFVVELLRQPRLPPLELPQELRFEQVDAAPRPRLSVKPAEEAWRRDRLHGRLAFDYDGEIVAADDPGGCVVQAAKRRALLRNASAERAAGDRLRQLGWRAPAYRAQGDRTTLEIAASRLPQVVQELTAEGWHVEAHGKVYRSAGRFDLIVSSGIDWFELRGSVAFGETVAQLPELLAALKRGENMVRLGDGSFGLLPQQWLKRYGLLAAAGATQEDHVRFTRSQVGLLDALMSAQPEARCDAMFSRIRDELKGFRGLQAADPPAGFRGELRPYQKEGLGWLEFLRRFGFGGCLADDMGLGKTVQVLALLEARRALRSRRGRSGRPPVRIGPSLVVVPKSLIFNWKQEAARFTPRLRVLDYTGQLRRKGNGQFEDYDLILTTYGTLRRDVVDFKDVRFDYAILDEAQAIKNADSVSAKAARLLQADHRLALSGTPIENHLGELWSLLEFLNPGMLGAASIFRLANGAARNPDEETRKELAHALRPFLLRRTKEQVLRDLPPKVEQTLYCELEGKQRKLYEELRDHYRRALLARIERDGIARSKIQILEALLRLRQAALHPGLLDERRVGEPSAKLDVLQPRLLEVLDEGHKALVFSQFTSMLAIVRESLQRHRISYEYLDGRTKDRDKRVARFQTAPDCRLFLISLKAGGLGLNLTAAQYVFLLDPWWNPAVEAQAIGRAHRIGQAKHVFAYRLISRDTIEERVLELQSHKRELADAIVRADQGLIRNLGREDLERLLS